MQRLVEELRAKSAKAALGGPESSRTRHAARGDAVDFLAGKIQAGGAGAWGPIPMPPQSLGDADARSIAQWLAAGAKR